MIKYIYAFGSICRGEIDSFSDFDLLVISDDHNVEGHLKEASLYKEITIRDLWVEGNPFAWHLYSEAKIIFTHNSIDLFKELGTPQPYNNVENDFANLISIFRDAKESIINDSSSAIFDLSIIFLVIRNIATCYELSTIKRLNFSRDSAILMLNGKLKLDMEVYETIKTCRLLSTRGKGLEPSKRKIEKAILALKEIEDWILALNKEFSYESV